MLLVSTHFYSRYIVPNVFERLFAMFHINYEWFWLCSTFITNCKNTISFVHRQTSAEVQSFRPIIQKVSHGSKIALKLLLLSSASDITQVNGLATSRRDDSPTCVCLDIDHYIYA